MEVDEIDEDTISDKEESCKQEDTNLDFSEKNVDTFKKPNFIARGPSKKSTLHKYLQQKKLINQTDFEPDYKTNLIIETEPVEENESNSQNVEAKQIPQSKPILVPYEEPEWKGLCTAKYHLEELKSGVIERTIDLQKKSYFCFGRVDTCDINMAHPTVSRFHAILQYRGVESDGNEKGFYLYDLKSTHGTFLNKYRIKPNVYARVKVGHMIKIGCSTRFYILQGPEDDEEEESPLTVTDLKAQRQTELEERKRKEDELKLLEEQEREKQEQLLEERGISWGMADDADEETDLSENPYAEITNEELYIDDPKKALRQWFDREGEELNFETEKAEKGLFVSKVILPIDDGDGREIIIEMTGRSKKESQVQCSLEACKVIDKMGLLRPAKREAKKQQKRNWEENDYYDSDEDSYLDRTGDLDKKREKRMRKAGKFQDAVETYDSLMEKHKDVLEKLQLAELKLNRILEDMREEVPKEEPSEEDMDELDAYMLTLKQKKPKKLDAKIAKEELNKLKEEEANLRKLINIAKPANMPELILKKTNIIKENVLSDAKSGEDNDTEHVEKKEETVKVLENTEKEEIEQKKERKNKKPSRVIGPTLPPPDVKMNKPVKSKGNDKPKKKSTNEQVDNDKVEDDVYSNCIWKPPTGQTGDGRTTLNDKYGY